MNALRAPTPIHGTLISSLSSLVSVSYTESGGLNEIQCDGIDVKERKKSMTWQR